MLAFNVDFYVVMYAPTYLPKHSKKVNPCTLKIIQNCQQIVTNVAILFYAQIYSSNYR